jgi:serine kinase of HPr protein (carbohydrate metabolism regulator)
MTAGLLTMRCISFGVPFQLDADSDVVLAKMLERAPLGTQCTGARDGDAPRFSVSWIGGNAGYRLVLDDEEAVESLELKPVLDQLARSLMIHVANQAPDRVFIHAGVVGWQGRALVLPGTSFAGKTTLVAELVRAGATYYSDEYAVLDEQGRVHPYPRDLQMREDGGVEQRAVAVEQFSGTVGTTALSVARVVFTEYVECGLWNPEAVSAGMAVLEMLRHAIPVQRTPARVMATLAKMMETAVAERSERGEARETAISLLEGTSGLSV